MQPREITVPLDVFNQVLQSQTVVFVSGKNSGGDNIVRIDPVSGEARELITEDGIEVGRMDILSTGAIAFSAFRSNDGATLQGILREDGSINYIDETPFDGEVRVLIRLQ